MRKAIDYNVIIQTTAIKLAMDVKDYIKSGFEPAGGVSTIQIPESDRNKSYTQKDDGYRYIQAVVKYSE